MSPCGPSLTSEMCSQARKFPMSSPWDVQILRLPASSRKGSPLPVLLFKRALLLFFIVEGMLLLQKTENF